MNLFTEAITENLIIFLGITHAELVPCFCHFLKNVHCLLLSFDHSLFSHSALPLHPSLSLLVAYTMAKYGMSLCVLGMSEEFKEEGVAVNALWPRTCKGKN